MKTEAARTARILLVDDNQHGLTVRRLLLQELGYSVEIAQSGEEAWELFQKDPFDVVVTDFRMGGMDGTQLIQLIRAADPRTRVIMLSGFANCLGMTEQSTGADEVLAKSNKEGQELVRAVKRLVAMGPRRKPQASEAGRLVRRKERPAG